MASFPSGVVILTAFGDDHQPRGLTVSAFCAVSVDPPLALVCIDKTSNTLPAVQHTAGFTPNILAPGRGHLPRPMATQPSDKLEALAAGCGLTTATRGRAHGRGKARRMKGRPRPREFGIIRPSPWGVAAIVTAERGPGPGVIPMQGAQPLAKPMPSRKPPATPPPW